jgi:hypothetical protein
VRKGRRPAWRDPPTHARLRAPPNPSLLPAPLPCPATPLPRRPRAPAHVGLRQVAVERRAVKLRQRVDLGDVAVDAVADGDVDEAVVGTQRHRGLGAALGERVQARARAAAEDDAKHRLGWGGEGVRGGKGAQAWACRASVGFTAWPADLPGRGRAGRLRAWRGAARSATGAARRARPAPARRAPVRAAPRIEAPAAARRAGARPDPPTPPGGAFPCTDRAPGSCPGSRAGPARPPAPAPSHWCPRRPWPATRPPPRSPPPGAGAGGARGRVSAFRSAQPRAIPRAAAPRRSPGPGRGECTAREPDARRRACLGGWGGAERGDPASRSALPPAGAPPAPPAPQNTRSRSPIAPRLPRAACRRGALGAKVPCILLPICRELGRGTLPGACRHSGRSSGGTATERSERGDARRARLGPAARPRRRAGRGGRFGRARPRRSKEPPGRAHCPRLALRLLDAQRGRRRWGGGRRGGRTAFAEVAGGGPGAGDGRRGGGRGGDRTADP